MNRGSYDQTVEMKVLSEQRSRSDTCVNLGHSQSCPLSLNLLRRRSSSGLSLFLIVLVVKVDDCFFSDEVVSYFSSLEGHNLKVTVCASLFWLLLLRETNAPWPHTSQTIFTKCSTSNQKVHGDYSLMTHSRLLVNVRVCVVQTKKII